MLKASAIVGLVKRRLRYLQRHPFDRLYGVDTSSAISPAQIRSASHRKISSNVGYVGSQPSVVRRSLERLPDLTGSIFLDLGCGKGRPCVIATEYPFRQVIGIEFGAKLAAIASRNARVIKRRFPARPAIDIQTSDATRFTPPDGDAALVVFLYNPFGETLIQALLAHLEAIVAGSGRKIFLVYYNPVHFAVFDAASRFQRYSAMRYDVTPEERAAALFGDGHESVIIYQSLGAAMADPLPDASRQAVVTIPDFGAVVQI